MIRVLCLLGGVCGAAGLSQYPEFSQQYVQRLGGQVDALSLVVKDFDASALAAGMGREEALEQLTGTAFLDSRQQDMRRTLGRHARLAENLAVLRNAGPLARITQPQRMADPETLQATWADFTPAVPLSIAGGASAGAGFIAGWGILAAVFALVTFPFRRSKPVARKLPAKPAGTRRQDPPVTRPASAPQPSRPTLQGVRR